MLIKEPIHECGSPPTSGISFPPVTLCPSAPAAVPQGPQRCGGRVPEWRERSSSQDSKLPSAPWHHQCIQHHPLLSRVYTGAVWWQCDMAGNKWLPKSKKLPEIPLWVWVMALRRLGLQAALRAGEWGQAGRKQMWSKAGRVAWAIPQNISLFGQESVL